jgi:Mce-associated membrane protein
MTTDHARVDGHDPSGATGGIDLDDEDTVIDPRREAAGSRGARRKLAFLRSASRTARWRHWVVFGVLPAVALTLGATACILKFRDGTSREDRITAIEATQVAKDSTVALLSYRPDAVSAQLNAARDRLAGTFRDSYTNLVRDVVIPGAQQKQISAVAKVPAAAAMSVSPGHAVVLVFVDQTVTMGKDAPTDTNSVIRVTLDKTHGRWLIRQFDPI